MAVKLRLTRVGSKKNPIYRVVAADTRSPRDGKFIEIVGRYNPQTDPRRSSSTRRRSRTGSRKGAQPSDAVARLLKVKNMWLSSCSPSSRAGSSTTRTPSGSSEIERDGAHVLQLHVAQEDVGKVIGRQGRIARALRTVVRAGAARSSCRVLVEIVD